ncbi:tetratricopeptide repeat protein [bacterium]|nr:tetratricopeptide repeat protein [bacterium]
MALALFATACGGDKKPEVKPDKQKEAESHYELCMAYFQAEKGSEALEECEKARDANPYDSQIHNALGLIYFHKERFEKAEAAYNEALRLDPKNSNARHNLGTLYLYLGRYNEATSSFTEALADDTYRNQANTLNGLGWAAYKQQDYVRAEQYFKEVLDRDARYLIAYDNLAKVYMATDRYDEAIEQLNYVLTLNAEYPEAHLDLALCFIKKNDKEKAREHLLKVLEVDPLGKLGRQAQEYLNILD